ncbi:MAG: hypothetical protein WCD42_13620 [Rhizomicrobium sp.]
MKKYAKPQAYVEATKDSRFAGTYEVLVPIEGRNKPHKIAQHFATQQEAENWMHAPEGQDAITDALRDGGK